MIWRGVGKLGSGQGQVVGRCEHRNEMRATSWLAAGLLA